MAENQLPKLILGFNSCRETDAVSLVVAGLGYTAGTIRYDDSANSLGASYPASVLPAHPRADGAAREGSRITWVYGVCCVCRSAWADRVPLQSTNQKVIY